MGELSRTVSRSKNQLVRLCWINLYASFFRLFGWVGIIGRYYMRHGGFALCDILLWGQYLFKNPYRHARHFASDNLYGETPLKTLEHLVKQCRILSSDVVYEIGCGTGRTAFWLHYFVKCRVVGIDHVEVFIRRANRVKRWCHLDCLTFYAQDVLSTSLDYATCIYFYGTAREDEFVNKLIEKFLQLKPGVRFITTSYPLSDYHPRFRVLKQFKGSFPWGKTDVYLQVLEPKEEFSDKAEK